ncbi:MAG: sensor histidine kinase [Ruminococcus sp.]
MGNIIIEVVTNLFQAMIFSGFLLFFFKPDKIKTRDIVAYTGTAVAIFAELTFFTFYNSYAVLEVSALIIFILELYSILFLKGNIASRIVMPLFSFLINTVISYVFGYLVSYLSGVSYYHLATKSSAYRLLCIIFINLATLMVYIIILKFRSTDIKFVKKSDLVAFVLIPVLAMVVVYSTFEVITITEFRSDILPYLFLICSSMIVIAVIVWQMMTHISRQNEIETKLLLSKQREKLYHDSILGANKQMEQISNIKHDMNNQLLCISELIKSKEYDAAVECCDSSQEKLKSVYTPISTHNPLLNAVLNVAQDKAVKENIQLKINIEGSMLSLPNHTDIVSIVGNLCDNAIEYLKCCPLERRIMGIEISHHKDYYIIVCKNKIEKSVFQSNPKFVTNKEDKKLHGRGISIIRETVKKYDGELRYYEEDGFLLATVVLKV